MYHVAACLDGGNIEDGVSMQRLNRKWRILPTTVTMVKTLPNTDQKEDGDKQDGASMLVTGTAPSSLVGAKPQLGVGLKSTPTNQTQLVKRHQRLKTYGKQKR
jgi:hypothetical protein